MRVPDAVVNAVAYIGMRSPPGPPERETWFLGSAFVVLVIHQAMGFYYLVTARHVAQRVVESFNDPFVRLNDVDGDPFEVSLRPVPRRVADTLEELTQKGEAQISDAAIASMRSDHWRMHPDPSVDLAVRQFIPFDESRREGHALPPARPITVVPETMFVEETSFCEAGLGVGDEVYVPSMFSLGAGEGGYSTIVRVGNLAMLPKHRVKSVNRAFGPMEAYLIEARSIGGMSGAPVLVRETVNVHKVSGVDVNRFDQTYPQQHAGGRLFLLGAIHGHWDIGAASLNDAQPHVGIASGKGVNMGVAIVTPATKLRELLYSEILVRERNAHGQISMGGA